MASDPFSISGNPFDVLGQDQSGQRSQLAQYALQRAAQQMQGNDLREAITSFRQALAYDPQNTTALTYIGNINLSLGNEEGAVTAFKNLVKLDPTSSDSQVRLANAYLQFKRYGEAEATYKIAARYDPTNPVPEYTLGIQYAQTDRLQEAEAQFRKVQRMAPADGNVYYALGALYNKQGRYEESVQELKTAVSLKAKFYDANYELGVAYTHLGMDDEANRQLEILKGAGSSLARDLNFEINRPKILFVDDSNSGFNMGLGAGTPVWMLDPANLTAAGSSKTFSVNIQFNTQMDRASIANLSNWTISRAKNATGGYYNNSPFGYASGTDAQIASRPLSVIYNSTTMQATVTFMVSQNSTGDATIDPKHVVFQFSGQDAYGRSMDTSADEIDGYSPIKGF
jgi:tetratricopeptide (TPR) repeat protein